jgi:methylated-DNA-[protein]-cysteine S-methyltransferase
MVTEFANQVYEVVKQIPEGKISTYKEVAVAIGKPTASRAVGQVLKKNPYAPIVPCHRVISSTGAIGGYFGVINSNTKLELLQEEGIPILDNKVLTMKDFLHSF